MPTPLKGCSNLLKISSLSRFLRSAERSGIINESVYFVNPVAFYFLLRVTRLSARPLNHCHSFLRCVVACSSEEARILPIRSRTSTTNFSFVTGTGYQSAMLPLNSPAHGQTCACPPGPPRCCPWPPQGPCRLPFRHPGARRRPRSGAWPRRCWPPGRPA